MRGSLIIVGVSVGVFAVGACTTPRERLPAPDSSLPVETNDASDNAREGGASGAATGGTTPDGGAGGIGGSGGTPVTLTPATLALDPLSKDLGIIVIGHYAEVTFQISNTGQAATSMPTVTLDGTNAAQYVMTSNACEATIDGGKSCLVTVRFAPTTPGLKTARLNVFATSGGAVTAMLQGTAVTQGALTIDPPNQSLGSVLKGQAGSPATFTITNTGASLTGALSTTISDSTEIAIATDGCNGMTLDAGAKCSITVTLTPMAGGQKSATLTVTASPGGTTSASLTGVGLAPALLTVTPATVVFGDTVVGTTSAPQTFTITNRGGVAAGTTTAVAAALSPSSGTVAGEFAIASNTCTATLGPGATCAVGVSFTPMSAAANKGATLTASATPGDSGSASMTGNGLSAAALSLSPATGASTDFGTIVTNTSASQTFVITNSGQQAAGAVTVTTTGTDFTISPPGTGTCTLAAGASCTIQVKFAPTTTGAKTSTLTASATTGGTRTLSLTGMSVSPGALMITPVSQNFGSLLQNTSSAPSTFTVTNTGGAATSALTTAINGSSELAITTDGCKAKMLASGGQCTITVTFSPTSAGQKTASLTVSAVTGGTASSNLSGTCLAPALLTVTPTIFTFPSGTVSGTTSAARTFTVTNTGGVASGTISAVVGGTDASQFGVASSTCTTLGPGLTCTIGVVFKPATAGTKAGALNVTARPGGSASAVLGATALAPAKLTIAPAPGASTNFGSILIGNTMLETFVVANAGEQAISTPLTITVSGTDFSVATPPATGDCASTTLLAPSVSCVVRVQFKPTMAVMRTGAVSVSAAIGGTATLAPAPTGMGVSPSAVSIMPLTQSFGSVQQGTPSASHTFTVTNTGGAATGVLATSVTPITDFAITSDGCKGKTLSPAGTCTLTVVTTPVAPPGAKSATLTVSGTPGGSAMSALSASSFTAASLALSPTTGVFGNVAVGATKDVLFTLSNSGTQTAAGIAKTIKGMGFSLPTPTGTECGTTLAGNNASCGIRVRFTPPGLVGPVTGTLTVTATTGNTPGPANLSANGYGIVAIPFAADTRLATLGGMDGAGTAVVGRMQNSVDTFGFYWLVNSGTVATIPPPPVAGETASGDARAISSNGLVVTGLAAGGIAWTWTPATNISRDLGFSGGSAFPDGIDKTGAVIVGNVFTDAGLSAGFVWRSAGGFEPLFGLQLTQVSDNGRLVGVGSQGPMTWTSSGNITTQPGASLVNATSVNAINGDGTVIVGSDINNAAVKWTLPFTGQPQVLPNLPNDVSNYAPLGVNQTGTVIVGATVNQQGVARAIAWTGTSTVVDITAAMAGAPNIASFSLNSARSVSADGKIIAGDGSFNGVMQPWVARLP